MNRLFFLLGLVLCLCIQCASDNGGNGGGTEPPAARPSLNIQSVTIRESDDSQTASIAINITDGNGQAITYDIRTLAGSASEGTDFQAINTSGSIPGSMGQSTHEIDVIILGDLEEETDENFSIELFNIENATSTTKVASITIQNDDSFNHTSGRLTVVPSIPQSGPSSPTSYPGMKMIWSDEFQINGINDADWTFEMGDGCPNLCGWGNNELQSYTEQNAVIQDNEYLVIEAREESNGGRNHTSTRMITKDNLEFKYGRVDIRAVLPKGQGIWPAIWMLGANIDNVGWPACGEIDIMELVGHEPDMTHSTVHYGDNTSNHNFSGASFDVGARDFSEDFHVFSMEWEFNKMIFYVDNFKVFEFGNANIQNNQGYPFNNDFFFIMNIAVGGNWPGNPDATTSFPQHMIVDYIRVFQEE